MKLLLDTHVFLWLLFSPEKLSKTAIAACQDNENALLLSVASLWEIQVKHQLGKLELDLPLAQIVREQTEGGKFTLLSIDAKHVLALSELTVTAVAGAIKATVRVVIAAKDAIREPPRPPAEKGQLRWSGEVPPQKWMHFYSKVLAKFVNTGGLTIKVEVEAAPEGGASAQQIDEIRSALQQMGLDTKIESKWQ